MFATGFVLAMAVFILAGVDRFRAWVNATRARRVFMGSVLLAGLCLMGASLCMAFLSWAWRELP